LHRRACSLAWNLLSSASRPQFRPGTAFPRRRVPACSCWISRWIFERSARPRPRAIVRSQRGESLASLSKSLSKSLFAWRSASLAIRQSASFVGEKENATRSGRPRSSHRSCKRISKCIDERVTRPRISHANHHVYPGTLVHGGEMWPIARLLRAFRGIALTSLK